MHPVPRLLLLAAGAVLLSAGVTLAQEGDMEADCSNAMTQADLNACAYKEYEVQDAALNAEYRKAMAKAKALDDEYSDEPQYAGAVEALKSGQRAWIGYRDGQCALAGFQARGGSAEPMLVSGCLADLTRKRVEELQEFVEGDG